MGATTKGVGYTASGHQSNTFEGLQHAYMHLV